MLISPSTYNSADGTWEIHTGFKTYIVNNRFDDINLDLPSEVIGLKYYAWVLFHFKLKGTVGNLNISSNLTNVYNSFLYTDLIHRYYFMINARVRGVVAQTFAKFMELLNGQLSEYSDKNIKVAIFNKENLNVLRTIFDRGLDVGVLLIMIDIQLQNKEQKPLTQHKQQIQEILDLARDLQTMEISRSDLLKFLKSIDINNITLNNFFAKLRSPDLNFLQEVFKSDWQNLFVEYRNKKMTRIGDIISSCDGEMLSDEDQAWLDDEEKEEKLSNVKAGMLIHYKNLVDEELSRVDILDTFPDQEKNCIEKVHKEINNVKNDLFQGVVQDLQPKTSAEEAKFFQLVDKIKIQLEDNEGLVWLLETLFKSKLEKNPDWVITKRLEGMALLANTNLNNLTNQKFQIIKKLLSKNHLAGKILTAYKTLGSLNMSHYTNLLTQHENKLKQIQSLLQVNEEEKATLKKITDILLGGKIGSGLLNSENVENFIQNWYSLKINEIPKLHRIFKFMDTNNIFTFNYKYRVKSLGYQEYYHFITDDLNIQGKDEDLIYVINRMEPLMKYVLYDSIRGEYNFVKKDVLGIEDIKVNIQTWKLNGGPQSNHKEEINNVAE
jgi:hypothetical protein